MKLATWYKLSLLLPLIAYLLLKLFAYHGFFALVFSFGMLPYLPFVLLVFLYWTIRNRNASQMSGSLWFLPLWYAVFCPIAFNLHWINKYGIVGGPTKGTLLLGAFSAFFALFFGYVFVFITHVLIGVLGQTKWVKPETTKTNEPTPS